jgi:ribonuclease HI
MPTYTVFTDGACSGNPGPGGWGAVVRYPDGTEKDLSGFAPATTNNRMELTAVLEALSRVPNDAEAEVVTDSEYVLKGATQWLDSWKRKGWKTSTKSDVLNRDLWECIDAERERLRLRWQWVRGHNGHPENERADKLAVGAIKGASAAKAKA